MADKPRGRDLGLPFLGEAGALNAITDVPGVEVGFSTLTQGKNGEDEGPVVQTGVTAILPRGRAAPLSYVYAGMHAFNGNGELTGSHWIRDAGYFASPICITNTHS
ncbi:MAG: P1 family peptidase, partial [Pseudomonadota bacterium]